MPLGLGRIVALYFRSSTSYRIRNMLVNMEPRTYSVPLLLKRQCDRTLGQVHLRQLRRGEHHLDPGRHPLQGVRPPHPLQEADQARCGRPLLLLLNLLGLCAPACAVLSTCCLALCRARGLRRALLRSIHASGLRGQHIRRLTPLRPHSRASACQIKLRFRRSEMSKVKFTGLTQNSQVDPAV